MRKTASSWFLTYSLLLVICGLTCRIALTISRHYDRAPANTAQSYRGAVDQLIADTIPSDWTAQHGLYLTHIADPHGIPRAFTYIGLTGDDHPILVARSLTTPISTSAAWDLTDPRSRDRFKRWLAEIARLPAESVAGLEDEERAARPAAGNGP